MKNIRVTFEVDIEIDRIEKMIMNSNISRGSKSECFSMLKVISDTPHALRYLVKIKNIGELYETYNQYLLNLRHSIMLMPQKAVQHPSPNALIPIKALQEASTVGIYPLKPLKGSSILYKKPDKTFKNFKTLGINPIVAAQKPSSIGLRMFRTAQTHSQIDFSPIEIANSKSLVSVRKIKDKSPKIPRI